MFIQQSTNTIVASRPNITQTKHWYKMSLPWTLPTNPPRNQHTLVNLGCKLVRSRANKTSQCTTLAMHTNPPPFGTSKYSHNTHTLPPSKTLNLHPKGMHPTTHNCDFLPLSIHCKMAQTTPLPLNYLQLITIVTQMASILKQLNHLNPIYGLQMGNQRKHTNWPTQYLSPFATCV